MSVAPTEHRSPFGVPWSSAFGFAGVVLGVFAIWFATFDRHVSSTTWVIRTVVTVGWVALAVVFGLRDIVAKRADAPDDIDHQAFDRWTIVHTTAGCLFGVWTVPLLVVALVTIGWEFFEKYVPGFGETEIFSNRVVDVLGAWVGWLVVAVPLALLEGDAVPWILPAADAWIRSL